VGIDKLIAYGDSKVIIDQVNKVCNIKKDTMDAYYIEVWKLEAHFDGLEFHHICRDNNVTRDILFKLGSNHALVVAGVFVQDLRKPSIKILSDSEPPAGDAPPQGNRDAFMAEAEADWRLDIITYILGQWVPEDKAKREKVMRRSAKNVIIGTKLYRRSASNGVLMKCILRYEGLRFLQVIHGGECNNHAASSNLVGKASRSTFYCPTAMADTQDLVHRCKGCSSSPSNNTSPLRP
jgi:hypothetical protein